MIGLELILQSAGEKGEKNSPRPCLVCVCVCVCLPVIMRFMGLTCPLRRRHPASKEDVKSVGGKTALTHPTRPHPSASTTTELIKQLVANTTLLSIYNSYMYVYQSQGPRASTPQCSILGEMRCHGAVNNYSMHN